MPNPTSYSWSASPDATPPTFVVQVVDGFTIRVIYSEAVVLSQALDLDNYSFDLGLTATAIRQISETVFEVTTSQQTPSVLYTLTVSGVSDLNGNTL